MWGVCGGCGCGCLVIVVVWVWGVVVSGGVLPVWLGGVVVSGGVGVGFDVGGRVFMFGGVSASVSGFSVVDFVLLLAPLSVVSVLPGSVSGCVVAVVGAVSSLVSSSGFLSVSGCAVSGGSVSGFFLGVGGGVGVCSVCCSRVW